MPARRKADRNRQALIVCEPCGYRLRGSRTQLARGIPSCPLCGERMLPDDFEIASVVLPLDELEHHPEYRERASAWGLASKQSLARQASCGRIDTGMSARWLRENGVDMSPRRWTRDDFEALGSALTLKARSNAEAIPF